MLKASLKLKLLKLSYLNLLLVSAGFLILLYKRRKPERAYANVTLENS